MHIYVYILDDNNQRKIVYQLEGEGMWERLEEKDLRRAGKRIRKGESDILLL